jgi:hypothetical protein
MVFAEHKDTLSPNGETHVIQLKPVNITRTAEQVCVAVTVAIGFLVEDAVIFLYVSCYSSVSPRIFWNNVYK